MRSRRMLPSSESDRAANDEQVDIHSSNIGFTN